MQCGFGQRRLSPVALRRIAAPRTYSGSSIPLHRVQSHPRSTGNSRVPFITHRSADLLSRDTTSVNGVPTTNATRTLLDVGSVVQVDVLEMALERALRSRSTNLDRLLRRFFEVAVRGRPAPPRCVHSLSSVTRRWRRRRVTSRRCSRRSCATVVCPRRCASSRSWLRGNASVSMPRTPS